MDPGIKELFNKQIKFLKTFNFEAGPGFQGQPYYNRLHKTDATLVY